MSHGFIPVANTASVELIYTVNGIVAENVLHVQKGSPYSLADLQAVRGIFDTWDNNTWRVDRANSATLNRIRSKALDSTGSPMEDYFLPTPRAGTFNSATLPSNVTWAIKLSTGLTGRSYRGRLYVVGLTAGHQAGTGNTVNTTWAARMVASLNTLLSTLASAGHTLGVVSYRANGAWRTSGVFTAGVSWVAVDYNFDSQRRRLTGRGI